MALWLRTVLKDCRGACRLGVVPVHARGEHHLQITVRVVSVEKKRPAPRLWPTSLGSGGYESHRAVMTTQVTVRDGPGGPVVGRATVVAVEKNADPLRGPDDLVVRRTVVLIKSFLDRADR